MIGSHDTSRVVLNFDDFAKLAKQIFDRYCTPHAKKNKLLKLYGVPKSGVIAATYMVSLASSRPCTVTPFMEDADCIIDDIVDSGLTRARIARLHPRKHFIPIIDKKTPRTALDRSCVNKWVVWPWESVTDESNGPTDAITRLLSFIGEDPTRDGLVDTPKRVVKAFKELTVGYQQSAKEILARRFKEHSDEMIVVDRIDFASLCEHHLLPFHGQAVVGYVPGAKREVVGLSKIPRLVHAFAKRLQVQERMTAQIADAIAEHLKPKGVGVIIQAHHTCMSIRGAKCTGNMTTSALRGIFKSDHRTRSEFLRFGSPHGNL